MSKDLERRLDRLATELTQGAVAPPPAAARRRGRRHRRRQLALGAVLVVVVAGVWAGPGAGLLDRPGSPSAAPGAPSTVAAPPLAVPKVAEGQFAVMIQDPPGGFPRRIQGPITNCGRIDTGANLYPQMVVGEVRYQAKILVVNVLPQPAVKEPPLQPRNFRTPWAVASLRPLDGNGGEDQPFLVAEQPQAHLQVDRADGTKGSIVGAYRVVRGVRSGAATTIQTIRELTGAQLAMAWNCEAKP